jgi:hypothetical protein
VEGEARVGAAGLEHRALQVAEEQLMPGRDSDVPCLTEEGNPLGVPAEGREQGKRVATWSAPSTSSVGSVSKSVNANGAVNSARRSSE